MLKKYFSIVLITLLSITLLACGQDTTTVTTNLNSTATTSTTSSSVVLPDLTGLSREEIETTLDNLGLTTKFYFDLSQTYDSEDDYDKFSLYGSGLNSGDLVSRGSEVKVYTSPLTLEPTYYNDLSSYYPDLQLEETDYQNQEFIADGIGVVTVERFVDGDTTQFRSGGVTFSVRYLGIDTPESTALYEPWGKAASNYTKERLTNAETIVLQAEGDRMDGNGRYLAWVWYIPEGEDTFILLNLELVEWAYSKSKVSTESAYSELLLYADWQASATKRRVWGEIDPQYDYSKEGTQMSITYLLENFNDYVGLKVVVHGEVTRKLGNNIYIQDETGSGIYMYAGFTTSAQLQVGANLTIGGLVPTYYGGSPQLSNFNRLYLTVNDDDYEIIPQIITFDDFDFGFLGTLVTIENLEVTSIHEATTSSSESIYVEDSSGNSFIVRIDDSTGLSAANLGINVGDTITVTGPMSYYDYDYDNNPETYNWAASNFQLMLITSEDIDIIN